MSRIINQKFNIGDEVICIDPGELDLTKNKIYIVRGVNYDVFDQLNTIEIQDDAGYVRSYCDYRFEYNFTKAKNHHKSFSVMNEQEAKPFIGKMMEFADSKNARKNKWDKGIFTGLRYKKVEHCDTKFPFETDTELYSFMRTCEETFKEPVKPGLIKAIKKSIQQWQIVYDTGKNKQDVYEFLGGKNLVNNCFLCDYTGYFSGNHSLQSNNDFCKKCIQWGSEKGSCYDEPVTQWQVWRDDQSKQNALVVLEHLKSELKRLEES